MRWGWKHLKEQFPNPQHPALAQWLPLAQTQSKKTQFQKATLGLLEATFLLTLHWEGQR